ncbi:bifunctional transcriptional activator/DNA repair enzyme AdaA [Halocynthiibacter sp.]|uniref:bifunctional transcriptional activator/DNA repair enzyme AdaA n=1 Tax=Halocynthiibacter sp. TaxID=1979210 RepID=UPI003C324B6E
MLFQLPDHKVLYRALTKRDPAWDGRAWVCVATTGIFCRLSCPARDPKPENCAFKPSVTECIEAGFRPCKRCHPLGVLSDDPMISDLVKALEKDPTRRWYENDIVQMGYDPSTVRRNFKRIFGMTFLEMARQRRLAAGFTTLSEGHRVIDAQLEAGFDSPSAFRAAFAKLIGTAPGEFSKNALLQADWFQTDLGPMIAIADNRHLHLLEFADRKALPTELKRLMKDCPGGIGFGTPAPIRQIKDELNAYFNGISATFTTPLAPHGTAFQKDVWQALRAIPAGEIRSYSSLAADLQRPEATRAVARANGANSIAIVIPCHRVIGADGNLTGYGGGIWRKEQLIEIEKKYAGAPT